MKNEEFDQNNFEEILTQACSDAGKVWDTNKVEIPKITSPFSFPLWKCPLDQLREQLGENLNK